jgi:hypothetical protein
MIGESRVDERFLSLQSLNDTATRLSIVIEQRIDQFREEFGHGAQSSRGTPVHPIPWLTEHELSARRMVPEIQPIVDRASLFARLVCNQLSSFATVDAADHDVDAIQPRRLIFVGCIPDIYRAPELGMFVDEPAVSPTPPSAAQQEIVAFSLEDEAFVDEDDGV